MTAEADERAKDRRSHDLAYGCFALPGLLALIAAVSNLIPMSTGTAGGIGFLVLIPLAMASLVAIPVGIRYAIKFRRDWGLVTLAILTVLLVLKVALEIEPAALYNALTWVYAIAVIALEASWFFHRRRRTYG